MRAMCHPMRPSLLAPLLAAGALVPHPAAAALTACTAQALESGESGCVCTAGAQSWSAAPRPWSMLVALPLHTSQMAALWGADAALPPVDG
jgi:hypothetical protein